MNEATVLRYAIEEIIWHFNKELKTDDSKYNDFCKGAVFGSMQTSRQILGVISHSLNDKQKKYIELCIDNNEMICKNKLFNELCNK